MRILTVGGSLPGIEHDSSEWTDGANIKDYDAVFLNLNKIVEQAEDIPGPTSEIEHRIKFPPREDIMTCLKSGNNVFLFLPSTRHPELLHVTEDNTQTSEFDLLSWLPFDFTTTEEPGNSVDQSTVPDYWNWYFDSDFDWPMYIEYVNISDDFKKTFLDTVSQNTIASTTFEEDIASRIKITGSVDIASAITQGQDEYDPQYPGSLYLLPIKPDWTFENTVRGILSNLYNWSIEIEQIPEPEWAKQYRLPKQRELAKQIKELRREYFELDEFRHLLYKKGDELENTVIQAFEHLGFQTSEERPGRRDGLLHLENHVFAIETHGTTNAIGIEKCRQLKNWVENAEKEIEDKEVHGLFIANAYRETPPSERGDSVVGDPLKFLQEHGYKVLETPVLYAILQQHQEGKISTEEVEALFLNDELFVTPS